MTYSLSSHPKTLVLSNAKGRWHAADHAEYGATMNGVEAWAYAYHGDYIGYKQVTQKDIEQYDIVIANTQNLTEFVKFAEMRPAHTRWVMLIEGDGNDYLCLRPEIQRAIAVSDVVNCINRFSVPLFRELARGTDTVVEYIGIPYPLAGVRQYAIPIAQRLQASSKEAMICPFLLRRSSDYLVARDLGIRYYGYEKALLRKLSNIRELWRTKSLDKRFFARRAERLYGDPCLDVRLSTSIHNFFPDNAHAYLWLNLDPRYTWARYVLDAAALGIPIITTASTGHGEVLFPQTTLPTHFDLKTASELGKRLVEDADFYRSVAEYAAEGMTAYSAEAMTERLTALLFLS